MVSFQQTESWRLCRQSSTTIIIHVLVHTLYIHIYEQIYYSQVHRCACSVWHFYHKLQILIQVVLKIMKRFLNFAPFPSAFQRRAPFLCEKIIEICLIIIIYLVLKQLLFKAHLSILIIFFDFDIQAEFIWIISCTILWLLYTYILDWLGFFFQLDSSLIHLEARLNDTYMRKFVNVVILSDHGMSYGYHPTEENVIVNKIKLTKHLQHGTYRWKEFSFFFLSFLDNLWKRDCIKIQSIKYLKAE